MTKTFTRTAYLAAELPIRQQLLRYFARDAPLVIFDVGACEGEDSVRYARLFPYAHIVAVEPVPENLRRINALLEQEALQDRVHVVPCALAAEAGRRALHVSAGQPEHVGDNGQHSDWDYGNKSSSLYPPGEVRSEHPWLRFDESIEVEVRTLAQVCAERHITHIDLLHMDVQGAELDVLRGAGDLLTQIKLVWLEVARVPLYAGQPLLTDVERFMAAAGFGKRKEILRRASGDQLYYQEGVRALGWFARFTNFRRGD